MKFLLSYKLFEKTSLINIGVPYSIMQNIQKNFTISDDAQWRLLKYKKNIAPVLRKSRNKLIISICTDKILIVFSYNNEYYVETHILIENDDFGNQKWQRQYRIKTTLTDVLKNIKRGCKSYELVSGEWSHEFYNIRKIKKEEINFENVTNSFKIDFAKNFTKIVKRLYGKKANIVTDIIINHLKNVKDNISEEKIREILFINVNRAKEIDGLKNKQKEKDPYKLYNNIVMENSLTIFNEYLIKFEEEYSNKYKEYLNIPIMIEKWSKEKIFTAFLYYIYSNKLINL